MPPKEPTVNAGSDLMRILVIERDARARDRLVKEFQNRGMAVTPVDSVEEAEWWITSDSADLVVADLASATSGDSRLVRAVRKQRGVVPMVITTGGHDSETARALRNGSLDVLEQPFRRGEIDRVIERALACRLRHTDTVKVLPYLRERLQFVVPSKVEFLDGVLNHLTERLIKFGIVSPQSSEVLIALDEAIVNAIKHGNGYDESLNVTIIADINPQEARFVVSDEGAGYRVSDVPDPCAPENLMRTSGRGLLLIRNIMDEVQVTERGNEITMVKRAEANDGGAVEIQQG